MNLTLQDIQAAWQIVKAKATAGGIDLQDTGDFSTNADEYCKIISHKLSHKYYLPEAYLLIKIKKDNHEMRHIALATVSDKIVQVAIKNKIEAKIEKDFADNSYAYRTGKGARKAINRVRHIINQNNNWVAKCDIDNFFDNIDHDLLFQKLRKYVSDSYYLELISMFIKMGYVGKDRHWTDRSKGTPQGAVLSPLLSNLYLNELDHFVIQNKIGYVRYADDFIILAKSKKTAETSLDTVMQYIRRKLKLELNKESFVRHTEQGFKFLGLWITKDGLSVSPEKINKIKNKINVAFQHSDFPEKYHQSLTGINRYYGLLIPQHYLFPVEDMIDKIWINKIRKIKNLRSRKAVTKQLEHLKYLTDAYNRRLDYHKKRLARIIFEQIRQPKIIDAEKAVRKRKKQYENISSQNNHIHIGGYGKRIGLSKKHLTVKEKNKKTVKIPLSQIKTISISGKAIAVSTKLIRACVEHKISLDFVKNNGQSFAKLYKSDIVEQNFWQQQQQFMQTPAAFEVGKQIILAKIKNQERLIRYFSKYAKHTEKDISVELEDILKQLKHYQRQTTGLQVNDLTEHRKQLIQIEARSGSVYWHWVRMMIDEETEFESRQYQGAVDLVNSMLNYGYAVLYRQIWTSVLQQGLYPGFSFIHTPSKKKGTLIFDLIEPFRQTVVDHAVISLINRKTKLEVDKKGLLTETTKQKLIKAVNKRLIKHDYYMKERLRIFDIIHKQSLYLKQYISGEKPKFKAYTIYKW